MFGSLHFYPDKGGFSTPAAISPGKAAFDSLCNDFHIRRYPDSAKAVLADYMEALSKELAPHFEKPAGYASLIKVKLHTLQFTVQSGFVRKIANAVTGANREGPAIVNLMENSVATIQDQIEEMEEVSRELSAKGEGGSKGEEIMLSQWVGLNQENLKKYKEGTLTIGEIFLNQPTAIIKNG